MGRATTRFEAYRAERHRPQHPEGETSGDYYQIRAAQRETCGCIAGLCLLAAVAVVIVAGCLHSCSGRPERAAAGGTLERPVIARAVGQ